MLPDPSSALPRIACVQYGDYADALARRRAGGAETYQAQFYTVDAYEAFVAGCEHLVVGIGTTASRRRDGTGTLVTVVPPARPGLPGRVVQWLLWQRLRRELEAFAPTHLVVRLNDRQGVRLLTWAAKRQLPVACIIASTLNPDLPVNRTFCALACDERVAFVANHLRVARQSLVDCGLPESKALAYDFPVVVDPRDHPPKTLRPGASHALVYAGVLSTDKGAGDLLDAFTRLRAEGADLRLTVCGDGELRPRFAEAARSDPALSVLGRVPHSEVLRLMREADAVIVPSRSTFAEGLPLTLLESLAVRTPVVASTHPVFRRYFRDGQGLAMFDEGDPAALAGTLRALLGDPARYAAVSVASADAWRSVQEPLLFHDLLQRLRALWRP